MIVLFFLSDEKGIGLTIFYFIVFFIIDLSICFVCVFVTFLNKNTTQKHPCNTSIN